MPAGYSGTPLAKKVGVREGHGVVLYRAPATWSIPELESGVKVRRDLRGRRDIVVAFVRSRSELRRCAPLLVRALPSHGALWLAWPRKAGGHVSDVSEHAVRDELLPTGLVDTKVAALDDDWSGLRFVWRRQHRPLVGMSRRRR